MPKPKIRASFLLAIFLALAGAARSEDDDAAKAERLIRALASDDPAERDRAVEALEDLGPAALPFLQKAEASSDPEVRSRVSAVLDVVVPERALGASAQVDLPEKSIPLKDAFEEIARQTHLGLGVQEQDVATMVWPGGGGRVGLWEAVDRLCAVGEGGLIYYPQLIKRGISIQKVQGISPLPPACYRGGLRLVAAQTCDGPFEAYLQWEDGLQVLAAPLAGIVTEAVDEKGRSLAREQPWNSTDFFNIFGQTEWSSRWGDGPLHMCRFQVDIARPADDATRISLLRGRYPVVAAVRTKGIAVDDFSKHVGETWELGKARVKLEGMEGEGNRTARFAASGLGACRPQGAPHGETLHGSWFLHFVKVYEDGTKFDAPCYVVHEDADSCVCTVPPHTGMPIRATRITVFDRCICWEVPFEFHDIPIAPRSK